jgi:dTDP-4-dehydrorhamnose reductase
LASVYALTKKELDIVNGSQIESCLRQFRPDIIINAAAYTTVDRAEQEPEHAYAINALGPENLARAAAASGVRLVHLSTDFVFDGSQPTPYRPSDAAQPLSVYGASKLAGEQVVRRIAGDRAVIVRTAWLYSVHGCNFVKTMLERFEQGSTIEVVADQIGSPTWARGLAGAIWQVAAHPELHGVFHWTDGGVASWYDLAVAVLDYAGMLSLVHRPVSIKPVRTSDYPSAAKRPAMSVLDKTDTWNVLKQTPLHWRHALKQMLSELARQQAEGTR